MLHSSAAEEQLAMSIWLTYLAHHLTAQWITHTSTCTQGRFGDVVDAEETSEKLTYQKDMFSECKYMTSSQYREDDWLVEFLPQQQMHTSTQRFNA